MSTAMPPCPPYLVQLENDRPDLAGITWIQLDAGCPDSQGSFGQLDSSAINVLGLRCPHGSKLRLQISFGGIYDILVPSDGGGEATLKLSQVLYAGDHGTTVDGWKVEKIPFVV